MTEQIFLSPDDLAKRWQMSKDTLANWRLAKKGPIYTKIGAGRNTKVLYRLSDIIEFESKYVSNNVNRNE